MSKFSLLMLQDRHDEIKELSSDMPMCYDDLITFAEIGVTIPNVVTIYIAKIRHKCKYTPAKIINNNVQIAHIYLGLGDDLPIFRIKNGEKEYHLHGMTHEFLQKVPYFANAYKWEYKSSSAIFDVIIPESIELNVRIMNDLCYMLVGKRREASDYLSEIIIDVVNFLSISIPKLVNGNIAYNDHLVIYLETHAMPESDYNKVEFDDDMPEELKRLAHNFKYFYPNNSKTSYTYRLPSCEYKIKINGKPFTLTTSTDSCDTIYGESSYFYKLNAC